MNNNQQPYEERTVIDLDTFRPPEGSSRPVQQPVPDGGESLLSPLGELAAIVGDVEGD